MNRQSVTQAAASLSRLDPVLARLIERHGLPPTRRATPSVERFAALARAILYQQLAGKAAAAIHGRFVNALGGSVTAASVLAAPPGLLTSCGLSGAKAAAIGDLAAKVSTGQVQLERIGRQPDETVVEHLVQVRGIGRWTAEMFLIGELGRPDVWPTGDYGVRAGYAAGWQLPEIPTPKELAQMGEAYRPYRSVVAWYCWRAADDRLAAAPTQV